MTSPRFRVIGVLAAASATLAAALVSTDAAAGRPVNDDVASYWTAERTASAQPRDLVIDGRGLGYMRGSDGGLTPYGHDVRARLTQEPVAGPSSPTPKAPPSGGGGDTTGPSIDNRTPAEGAKVGGSVTFSASVSDLSGIRSVSFVIVYPDRRTQSFTPSASGDVWSTTLNGFSDGAWGWYVVAKDGGPKGGNTTTSSTLSFTVDLGSGGGGGGGGGGAAVANSPWSGGDVQLAAGRILFEMPQMRGKRITGWVAYVCSGTTVTDTNTGASVVLTAAHCVYDDVAKVFARNVLFIPNQAGTTGVGTDSNCSNDPFGCFSPSHGVVDANWTTRTFPDNVEWDYAYYVVPISGAHSGKAAPESLEEAVTPLAIGFDGSSTAGTTGKTTHALGYSYSDDPHFMYCAEPMTTTSDVNWWLPSCGLTGGSSGGPWIQPMDPTLGRGPIISVNSWGYTGQPGMAGPHLDGSASCVYAQANNANAVASDQGVSGAGLGVVVPNCTD